MPLSRGSIHTLVKNPTSRRIIVNGWKPEAIKQSRGALPPCHIAWHLIADVENKQLSLAWWQRSVDMTLGLGGGNMTAYAFLLSYIARLTGYKPKWLIGHLDDCHIYRNHIEGVEEQLTRTPGVLPKLVFKDTVPTHESLGSDVDAIMQALTSIRVSDMDLIGYAPQDPIKFEMAA